MTASHPQSAREVMRFHLIYHGQLPSSGNKAKPEDVMRIRREISPQLKYLWETHHALSVLRETAVVKREGVGTQRIGHGLSPRQLAEQYPSEYEHLAGPLAVRGKSYLPLVRESLSLSCELSVLFLRQDEPGKLLTQGGDIDGRMKCLLDALRMPSGDEQERAPPPEDHLWCLMEGDELVTRLDIETDRLLIPRSEHQHEVHLDIEVTINVLKVGHHNMALL
ncbi:hypothetical protein GCM10010923_14800 [Blastomonas marina]|uniref:Uncharacterized protein n=1 Tax=Blastomonas marina TaxID=1867408 RepID=A0ABQ1FDE9_9SPHN|nr:hypothetical protein GCM10010923_14800 [Blastomonas marina]